MWPFKSKPGPEMEQRAAFPVVTHTYIENRRKGLLAEGDVALSATVQTAVHYWQSAFSMLEIQPEPLPGDVLARIGQDLVLRGESCWHIRFDGSELQLVPVAYWDELGNGWYHLHIVHPNHTESVRALEGEVLKLVINPDPAQPWRGRSPFRMMGLSGVLLAEIENAISGAMPMAGKGLLPFPSTIEATEKAKALSGLQGGSLVAITSKADHAVHTGGDRAEWRRVELTPDLQKLDINTFTQDLANRMLTGCGIPPTLMTANGNAGAMREGYRLFALQTVLPLSKQLLPELRRKLNVGAVSIDSMLSADVAGRARAVGVLVTAGVPLHIAMELSGWTDLALPMSKAKREPEQAKRSQSSAT
ncbi:phage portal family protein [Albibacillus kandeliae]|uniref:hypothetical protein n=1 Tax=Albibacillus kandeliae TaxID=2174228 RepID=UPI000D69DE8E|nr:hypothetical protein [Albibacillus kandeliae]